MPERGAAGTVGGRGGARSTGSTVRFVVSALEPRRGMERAALDVVERLRADGLDVELRVLGPGPPPRTAARRARALLASALPARAAVREPAAAVVTVGIWVALRTLPWAGRGCPPVIAWEHSLTRERRALSRSFALVAAVVLPLYRRRAAAVVAVGPAVAEALGPRLAPRAAVIANPVAVADPVDTDDPVAVADPANPDGPPQQHPARRLLALGGLVPIKAPHLLLEMMAALHQDTGDIEHLTHLDVAGDGPLLTALRRDAARAGLADRVTFHGFVPDVAPLLARADALVHTSASETFGYALLEAAAAGVPVVAVENTQTRHLVPHLVPGRTCAASGPALADAVRTLVPPTPAEAARAARARREALDPAALAPAWRAVLQRAGAPLRPAAPPRPGTQP